MSAYDPAVEMAMHLDARAAEIRAAYARGEEPTEPLPTYTPPTDIGTSGQSAADLASAFIARATGTSGETDGVA